jgi:multiple sugar transport system permease protein
MLLGIPAVVVVYLSLTDAGLRGRVVHFVGFGNYIALLSDGRLLQDCETTLLIALSGAALQTVFGLFLALALDAVRRGAHTLLALAMLPLIPMDVNPPDWLGDPNWARAMVVAGEAWRALPFAALVIYAGLQMIDRVLVDAARIDGATPWRVVWHVVLPALRPVLLVVFGLRLMDGVRLFDLVYVLTDGGPGSATETISFYAYTVAMRRLEIGQAAAIAVVAALLALTPLLVFAARRR